MRRTRTLDRVLALLLMLGLLAGVAPARAQDAELEGMFENLGKAQAVDDEAASSEAGEGEGTIRGNVFDGESGAPIAGVTIIVVWPAPGDGVDPLQEVRVTDGAGSFEFPAIPEGQYTLSFIKVGYRTSSMTGFEVVAGQNNPADFPMPPVPTASTEQVLELDAFVVEASTVNEMMNALELRMDSDELLNVMNAEELAKFAAGDVAEALKRVSGVNVVEGQFAIIRGLEDRYSSTLYNSAPLPSPDPDKQSVQLDLFPSDVVDSLVVSKTFGAALPSNSSGGSIDVVTHQYTESPFKAKFSAGTGYNANARDRFLNLAGQSPIGTEEDTSGTRETDYAASLGGRRSFLGREFRFKGVFQQEIDYQTKTGFQEDREPRTSREAFAGFDQNFNPIFEVVSPGDGSNGELNLSGGRWDLTESERSEQKTNYFGFGFDLDTQGTNRLDASIFHTSKQEDTVQVKENGHLPCFSYGRAFNQQQDGSLGNRPDSPRFANCATRGSDLGTIRVDSLDNPNRGALVQAPFMNSKAVARDRELFTLQGTGVHGIWPVEGLTLRWAANHASTTQTEELSEAKLFYEPVDKATRPDVFPATAEALGPGRWGIYDVSRSDTDVDESQNFVRFDLEYERGFLDDLVLLSASSGGWFENSDREVSASFLQNPTLGAGGSDFFINGGLGSTPAQSALQIAETLLTDDSGALVGTRRTTNDSTREVQAWNVGGTITYDDDLDLIAGLRFEDIQIESNNDPFTGEPSFDGSPGIFPTKYLFFDRLDNPARNEGTPIEGATFNDQILGINLPTDENGFVDLRTRSDIEALINGEIDETRTLPTLGFAYGPLEGLQLRGAWSKTVARPSFREMGYYVSVRPDRDGLVVGNPRLQLSDVESWDARVEYTWGPLGDLAAFSIFKKEIELPIETIVIRNPVNRESGSGGLFRTFFNNPNTADLWGFELEARKHFDFLPFEIGEYISVGGNYTFIDAEVDRTETELARAEPFFGVRPGDPEPFTGLESSRRLFGQPEWIMNADISFDHPDWGTKATLAWFSISDILDAAGSAAVAQDGAIRSLTLDEYVDEFDQLDLILSQQWRSFTFKLSIKNLTDSKRGIIYDPEQTAGRIEERSYRIGRDWSFSVGYTLEF